MIVCEYKELMKYETVLPHLKAGIECVEKLREEKFPAGTYEFDGGYLMVQRGCTGPFDEGRFETHRVYIDVQYMIEGGETAWYAPISDLEPENAYDEGKDIGFFRCKGDPTPVSIRPGMCWAAFPEDGHMPCRYRKEPNKYVKIVMKLPC